MTIDLPLWIDVRLMAIERIARDINLYRFERPNGEALPCWDDRRVRAPRCGPFSA
jgi:hypothetical protein